MPFSVKNQPFSPYSFHQKRPPHPNSINQKKASEPVGAQVKSKK
jgi:hypothetical protein